MKFLNEAMHIRFYAGVYAPVVSKVREAAIQCCTEDKGISVTFQNVWRGGILPTSLHCKTQKIKPRWHFNFKLSLGREMLLTALFPEVIMIVTRPVQVFSQEKFH